MELINDDVAMLKIRFETSWWNPTEVTQKSDKKFAGYLTGF